jgi:hypothetical protein
VGCDHEQYREPANSIECVEVATGARLFADDIVNRRNGNPADQRFDSSFQRCGGRHGREGPQRTDFWSWRQADPMLGFTRSLAAVRPELLRGGSNRCVLQALEANSELETECRLLAHDRPRTPIVNAPSPTFERRVYPNPVFFASETRLPSWVIRAVELPIALGSQSNGIGYSVELRRPTGDFVRISGHVVDGVPARSAD